MSDTGENMELLSKGVLIHPETGVSYLKTVDVCPFAVYRLAVEMKVKGWGCNLPAITCPGEHGTTRVIAGLTSVVAACIAGVKVESVDAGKTAPMHLDGVDYWDRDRAVERLDGVSGDVARAYRSTAAMEDLHHMNASDYVASLVMQDKDKPGYDKGGDGFDRELWSVMSGVKSDLFCVWDDKLPGGKALLEFQGAHVWQQNPSVLMRAHHFVEEGDSNRFKRVQRRLKVENRFAGTTLMSVTAFPAGEKLSDPELKKGDGGEFFILFSVTDKQKEVGLTRMQAMEGDHGLSVSPSVSAHRSALLAGAYRYKLDVQEESGLDAPKAEPVMPQGVGALLPAARRAVKSVSDAIGF